MSHYVNIISEKVKTEADIKRAKQMLWAHGEEDCERNSDGQGGLSSRPVWENRTFESYDEACDYLSGHNGSYWIGGCFAKVYQKNAKAEEVKNRIAEAKRNLAEYVKKADCRNFKSAKVSCPNCGSNLNKNYVKLLTYSQPCPLCGTDLFSKTVQEGIKTKKAKIAELEKKLEKSNTKKYDTYLLFKYEFHC